MSRSILWFGSGRGERHDILYYDSGVSIHSDVSVVLGIDTYVGNAGSCGEKFAAATVNRSEPMGVLARSRVIAFNRQNRDAPRTSQAERLRGQAMLALLCAVRERVIASIEKNEWQPAQFGVIVRDGIRLRATS
jgi:hypothetical protein